MIEYAEILLGLLPVIIFLISLIILDSYKLVKLKLVIVTIIIGCLTAFISLYINKFIYDFFSIEYSFFVRYIAPVIEETVKSIFMIYLIKSHRIGFLVDAAILGFAVGTGFALVENIIYWNTLENTQITLWIVRGFGTAAMHGGTIAIFAILSRSLFERKEINAAWIFLPALMVSIIIHSIFNHFILPPELSTVIMLIIFTLLIIIVFHNSEKATRHWLGSGLDADLKLYEAITNGKILDTRIGVYLESLNDHFPIRVVVDMLSLIRTHLELSMRAKGILLMRESSIKLPKDDKIKSMFDEMESLKKSIGPTGLMAINPYLQKSSRDLWQIYMLDN